MPKTKVSVIMAVYNAEPYLSRCLNSLQAQTLKDFDVILVDDGSTDRSLAIAEEYAKQNSRFRVYHKENGGVSSARQFGIERLAEKGGKYSIHVDPDDWVEPQMLERFYRKAEDTGADMVVCDYYINTEGKQLQSCQDPMSEDPRQVLKTLLLRLHGSLCNKLVRTACYEEASIRFPKGLNYCEDLYANICLLQKMRKVAYLPEALYHYDCAVNSHAETRNFDSRHVGQTRTEIVERCREVMPECLKGWQFHVFEAKNAFSIIRYGCMGDGEFKSFFKDISVLLLRHLCCWRPYVIITILAVHTPIKQCHAAKLFNVYDKAASFFKRYLNNLYCI